MIRAESVALACMQGRQRLRVARWPLPIINSKPFVGRVHKVNARTHYLIHTTSLQPCIVPSSSFYVGYANLKSQICGRRQRSAQLSSSCNWASFVAHKFAIAKALAQAFTSPSSGLTQFGQQGRIERKNMVWGKGFKGITLHLRRKSRDLSVAPACLRAKRGLRAALVWNL